MTNRLFRRAPQSLALGAVLSAALPFASTALAQTSGATGATAGRGLDPLVVTATRVEQPLSDLVADVSIVDRTTIERSGASALADVLARLPGVELSRSGGPGGTTSVFLRGAESRFTAVYIDGVRVDSQSTGGASWESIPLALIDRIEVLRGPAAAVYGSDAMGGVVQIFTKRGENGFAPFVSAGVGSYGTYKADAGFSGAAGGFDYALGVSHTESRGFNSRPIPTQNPDADGYRSRAANARLGFQINKDQRIEGTFLTSSLNSQYDTSLTSDDRSIHKLQAAGLNWTAQWNEMYKTKVSVSDSRDRYETRPSPYLTTTNLRGYLFQNELKLGNSLVTAALERKEDNLENAPIDRGRAQNALALGYGLRAGAHTVQVNVRRDDDSEFGGQNTGSLAYGYAVTPAWRLTGSVGTAFRAPTLYQRFSEYGVSTLQPEKSRNIEAGARYAQGDTTFGVVVYRNQVSNLITFAAAGPCASTFGCYANTARAEYKGITFSASHRLAGVTLRGSLDLQDPRDRDTDKLLARRARRHGTIGADTVIGSWTVGGEAQFSSSRFDDAANAQRLGGYTLVNLYASMALTRDWTLLGRIDNLTDKDYQLVRNYATAGRSLYVGVRWAPRY